MKKKNVAKMQINRETLRALTESQVSPVAGNQPVTGATIMTCCLPSVVGVSACCP